MMSSVNDIIGTLSDCIARVPEDERRSNEFIKLGVNWCNRTVFLEYFLACDSQNSTDSVTYLEQLVTYDQNEHSSYEEFISMLKNELRNFSLINFRIEITMSEISECADDDVIIFHSESCQTFREKVLLETGLSRLQMLEVDLSKYRAMMYLFVLPEDQQGAFQNALFTPNYYNVAATNSFVVKIINMVDELSYVAFLGYIQNDNHMLLKKCFESVASIMRQHLKANVERADAPNLDHIPYKDGVVDLTDCTVDAELEEQDDEIFYELNTSDDDADSERTDSALMIRFIEACGELLRNDHYRSEIQFYESEDKALNDSSISVAQRSTDQQLQSREIRIYLGDEDEHFSRKFGISSTRLSSPILKKERNIHKQQSREVKEFDEFREKLPSQKQTKLSFSSTRPPPPSTITRRSEIKRESASLHFEFTKAPLTSFSRTPSRRSEIKNPPKSNLLSPDEAARWNTSGTSRTRSLSIFRKSNEETSKAQQAIGNQFLRGVKAQHEYERNHMQCFKIPKISETQTPSSVSSFISPERESIVIDDDDDNDLMEIGDENRNTERKHFKYRNSSSSTTNALGNFGNTRKRR